MAATTFQGTKFTSVPSFFLAIGTFRNSSAMTKPRWIARACAAGIVPQGLARNSWNMERITAMTVIAWASIPLFSTITDSESYFSSVCSTSTISMSSSTECSDS